MSSWKNMTVNRFAKDAELLLKMGTIVLGLLYVLGFLVSNIQLMELGISDFTSLQSRNVMTGVLFSFFFALLFLAVMPTSLFLYVCVRVFPSSALRLRHRVAICVGAIIAAIFLSALFVYVFGIWLGFLYPWGRQWEAGFSRSAWSWQFQKADLLRGYDQFVDTFGHTKIIVAGIALSFASIYPVDLLARHLGFGQNERDSASLVSRLMSRLMAGLMAGLTAWGFLALLLALVGFAQEVYPNIKHNLGGGQPDVAVLQIETEGLSGIRLPGIIVCCDINQVDEIASTEHLVVWYQSDKFLYVTPLVKSDQATTRLIALDIQVILVVQYIPISVRVKSGRRITSVHRWES